MTKRNTPLAGDLLGNPEPPSPFSVSQGSSFGYFFNFSPTSDPHFHLQWGDNNPGKPMNFVIMRKVDPLVETSVSDWTERARFVDAFHYTDVLTAAEVNKRITYKLCFPWTHGYYEPSYKCWESDPYSTLEDPPTPDNLQLELRGTAVAPEVRLSWKEQGKHGLYDRYQVLVERRSKLSDGRTWSEWSDITTSLLLSTNEGIDSHLRPNTEYQYRLSGKTPYGRSDYSSLVTVFIPNTRPDAPESCSAFPLNTTSIQVNALPTPTWPLGKGGQVSGYRVYRSQSGLAENFILIGPMESNRMTDTGRTGALQPGTSYVYAVRAVNEMGESPSCTTTVSIPTAPPPTPTALQISPDVALENATLSWTHGNDPLSDVSLSFTVWHALQEAGPYEQIVNLIFSERSFTTPLRDGAVNYFYVKTDNTLYSSPPSNTVSVSVPPAVPVLNADPVVHAAPLSPSEVRLSWRTDGLSERRVRIQRSPSGAPDSFTDIHSTAAPSVSSFVDSGLEQDSEYFYRIFAFNATGESPPSAITTIRTLPGHVFSPSFLRARALSNARVQLDWWDINTAENGYSIEYSTTGADGEFTEFARVGKDTETFTTSELLIGMQFTFRVRAYNRAGLSDVSDSVSVLLPNRAPPAPFALEGQFTGQANLRWQISEAPECTQHPVFVTQNEYTPADLPNGTLFNATAFEGLAGADALCQFLGRSRGGIWKAILSDSTQDAKDRLQINGPVVSLPRSGPSVVVAESPEELWSGTLRQPIAFEQNIVNVHSGTHWDGTAAVSDANTNCNEWTSTVGSEEIGRAGLADKRWISLYDNAPNALSSCNNPSRLYCIQVVQETTVCGNGLQDIVQSFVIERSENATEGFEEITTVSFDPQCKFSTQGVPGQECGFWNSPLLSPGDDFYFRIRAKNSAGVSDPSDAVQIIGPAPLPPATPTDLTAAFVRGASGGTLLTWTDDSENSEEYYEIERKIDAISPDWIPFFLVPADTVTFLDPSYSLATMQYRVRARNRGGFSDWSNEVSFTHPPSSPFSLVGSALPEGIALQWQDASANESNFIIQRAVAPRDEYDFAFVHQTGPDETTFTDATVQKGITYHYRLLARNAGGDSLPSNILVLTALPDPPSAPSDLALSTVIGSSTILQLRWTDNAIDETGFIIERSLTGEPTDWITIATKTADETLHNDFDLSPNTAYFYRIHAFNAGGRSDPTEPQSILTPMTPPNAPATLTAEVLSSARVVLRWTDRSSDEGAFEVERAMNAAGPWTELSTTLENSTMFTDTNVQAETQYFYRVRAVKLSAASPFTPPVAVTTPTFIGTPNNLFATVVSYKQIDLRWADRSDNETGFSIERRNEQDLEISWTLLASVEANVTAYQDRELLPANHYLYRIRAVLGTMSSEYSNDAPATTFPCVLDGMKEPTEFCDDANPTPGDGCSPHCVIEEEWSCTRVNGERSACQRCGNSTIEGNETCDDGNTADGDGCGGYACWKENGWTCTGEPSVCLRCGNGIIEEGETCEDGNTDAADGCDQCHKTAGWTCAGNPSICQKCGNGILEGTEKDTGRCDDGDTESGDGCSATCTVETGWACYGWTESICKKCGNGILEGNETCDDQNTNPNDGCSNSCLLEPRWTCTGTPSTCYRCGDGIVDPGQECDQQANQTLDGDGCSSTCLLEPGWSCTTGNNSLCAETCGDGVKNGADTCDDGDLEKGDGCSASCRVESGWTCSGTAPSRCQSALASTVRRLMQIGPQAVPTVRQRFAFFAALLRAEQSQNVEYDVNGDGLVDRRDTRLLLTALRSMMNP